MGNKIVLLEEGQSTEFKDIHEIEKKYPDKELATIIPTVQ